MDYKQQHSGSGTLHASMHGILCVSGKLSPPWTCDLAHYFCHLLQDWSVFGGFFLFFFVLFLNSTSLPGLVP